jgi:hypothetical protein
VRITSFSAPKFKDHAGEGDDVLLVVPQRVYAVFDGATDATGTQVGHSTPGRFAASRAAQAAARMVLQGVAMELPVADWVAAMTADMNAAIASGLAAAGAAGIRASSTVALAADAGDHWRFLIVGDSGIRLNGSELHRYLKDVDVLYTLGRGAVRQRLQAKGLEGDVLEATTRKLVFRGLREAAPYGLLAHDVAQIVAATRRDSAGRLQPDAMAAIEDMLMAGISGGQYPHCNRPGHSLGYASLDGTHTQGPDVVGFSRQKSDVRSIEFFTDGYLALPVGTDAQAWEHAFARVEAEDFHKTGAWAGVKGSSSTYHSDDRTVLCLEALTA